MKFPPRRFPPFRHQVIYNQRIQVRELDENNFQLLEGDNFLLFYSNASEKSFHVEAIFRGKPK